MKKYFESPGREPRAGFDKFPRWIIRDPGFPGLDPLAIKLLGYLCASRKWGTDTTAWTTVDQLSKRIGASWRRTKRALLVLGTFGVIRTETERREKRFRLIYRNPQDHSEVQAKPGHTPLRPFKQDSQVEGTTTEATPTLDVQLDASVEGHSPSSVYAEMTEKPDRFDTQVGSKRQASEKEPGWITDLTHSEQESGYAAGVDSQFLGAHERGLA